MKKLVKIMIINGLVVLFFIGLIDVMVRITHPEINPLGEDAALLQSQRNGDSYGFNPNMVGYSFGAKVVTDARGFRIDPSLPPLSPDKPAILVLGDSVSMGVGVEAAKTFPFLLQRKLPAYRIINASVTGYGIADYLNVLEALLPKIEFSGVIVGLCLNDFSNVSQRLLKEHVHRQSMRRQRYPNPILRYLWEINYSYLNIYDLLKKYSMTFIWLKSQMLDKSINYFIADTAIYDTPDIGQKITKYLSNLKIIVSTHGKWLIVYIFPYEYQLRQNIGLLQKPQQLIDKAAKNTGLAVVDLLPTLREQVNSSKLKSGLLFLYDDPMHFSILGHRLVAQAILDELERRQLAEKALSPPPCQGKRMPLQSPADSKVSADPQNGAGQPAR